MCAKDVEIGSLQRLSQSGIANVGGAALPWTGLPKIFLLDDDLECFGIQAG
jgi:hypothetical protein